MTLPNLYFYSLTLMFISVFLSLGLWLHTSYTKMDEILKHLSNCRAIQIRKPLMGNDPFGRLFMMGAVSGILTAPKLYLRDGGADLSDIENFPKELKKTITRQYGFLAFSVAFMFVTWGIGQYMNWTN